MSLEPFVLRDGTDCLASVAFEWVVFSKTSLGAPCPRVRRFFDVFLEPFGSSVTRGQLDDRGSSPSVFAAKDALVLQASSPRPRIP